MPFRPCLTCSYPSARLEALSDNGEEIYRCGDCGLVFGMPVDDGASVSSPECTEERGRLLASTAWLQARTEALKPPTPFSRDEHGALRDLLHQHRLDLADFRTRCAKANLLVELKRRSGRPI